jgi:hypothetical protein
MQISASDGSLCLNDPVKASVTSKNAKIRIQKYESEFNTKKMRQPIKALQPQEI